MSDPVYLIVARGPNPAGTRYRDFDTALRKYRRLKAQGFHVDLVKLGDGDDPTIDLEEVDDE